jgi:hypothetical protein
MLSTISIFVAIISLIVSFTALYLSYLKKPSLSAYAGPPMLACYDNSGLTLTVPVTIANSAPKTGIVRRSSLTIKKEDSKQRNFYLEWNSFRKLTADGSTWVQAGTTHAIPIIGHSTDTKYIKYVWNYSSKPEFRFEEGTYKLRFDFWSDHEKPFETAIHMLTLSTTDVKEIDTSMTKDESGRTNSKVVYLSLDSDTTKNKVLTDKELKTLLDKK